MAKYDITCVADLGVDLVVTGNVHPEFGQIEQIVDGYDIVLGGSVGIFASGFGKLGGSIAVVGVSGDGALDEFVRRELQGAGVDTSQIALDPTLKTGISIILADSHDRAILTYPGTFDSVVPEMITDEVVGRTRHWHIGSLFLLQKMRSHWVTLFTRLKAAGVSTSLDPNWDPAGTWGVVTELLPLTDIFLPNEQEALAITGASSVDEAGRYLSRLGPVVVIKQGQDGATLFADEVTLAMAPPPPPGQVVDAIGAGDNFDAGFLRAWLLGLSHEQCLANGLHCGTFSITAAGGVAAQVRELVSTNE